MVITILLLSSLDIKDIVTSVPTRCCVNVSSYRYKSRLDVKFTLSFEKGEKKITGKYQPYMYKTN